MRAAASASRAKDMHPHSPANESICRASERARARKQETEPKEVKMQMSEQRSRMRTKFFFIFSFSHYQLSRISRWYALAEYINWWKWELRRKSTAAFFLLNIHSDAVLRLFLPSPFDFFSLHTVCAGNSLPIHLLLTFATNCWQFLLFSFATDSDSIWYFLVLLFLRSALTPHSRRCSHKVSNHFLGHLISQPHTSHSLDFVFVADIRRILFKLFIVKVLNIEFAFFISLCPPPLPPSSSSAAVGQRRALVLVSFDAFKFATPQIISLWVRCRASVFSASSATVQHQNNWFRSFLRRRSWAQVFLRCVSCTFSIPFLFFVFLSVQSCCCCWCCLLWRNVPFRWLTFDFPFSFGRLLRHFPIRVSFTGDSVRFIVTRD